MHRSILIASLVALMGAGFGSGQGKKKEVEQKPFVSTEFKFRTHFPEKDPKETTKKLKTNGGELEQATASVELKDATYSVAVTVLPEVAVSTGAKAVIDGVRDGIKGKDGKVESEKPWEQGDAKTPGREILIDFRKNQLRTRVFLVGNRLYQVTVTGPKAVVAGDTAGKFFSAFEVAK